MAYRYVEGTDHQWRAPKYPPDVYISYARAMFLEVERRVIDTPPRRPAEFWRIVEKVREESRIRLRTVQTDMQG